jgi:asparagine synthase (glutamine-hydrolysing)
MCGICGILNFNEKKEVDKGLIRRMTSALKHRGPDDEGYYMSGPIGLGVRRLSVIDITGGHQPISNENRTVWVAFNGEIYNYKELREQLEKRNHKFKTLCDTEVISHLYEELGKDCIKELNGMFAFALWDTREHAFFLARDRVGIKPLFYRIDREKLCFASEIKCLLQDSSFKKEINYQALQNYFTFLYIPGPDTIFKGIKKLQPGHILEYKNGEVFLQKYWNLPTNGRVTSPEEGTPNKSFEQKSPPRESKNEKYYTDGIIELLQKSVKRQLVSDVPLGVFLSGGIDSSAIVAFASKIQSIKTFSIGFKNSGHYDERRYAKSVSERFGTEHYEFEVEPRAIDILPVLIKHFDEPFADPSAIPTYYLAKLAREQVVVALSGTGGDEIFAGYRRYLIENLIRYYSKIPPMLQHYFEKISRHLPVSRISSLGEYFLLFRKFLECRHLPPNLRHLSTISFFTEDLKQNLYNPSSPHFKELKPSDEVIIQYYRKAGSLNELDRTLYADFHTLLPDDFLIKEDRMAMAVSLENRVPFLDHELVEFAALIPSDLKVKGLTTKYILRKALSGILPSKTINRIKHGFGVPLAEWFRTDLKSLLEETLLGSRFQSRELFNIDYIRLLIEEHQKGFHDFSQHLWALLIFELWCQEYLDTSSQIKELSTKDREEP